MVDCPTCGDEFENETGMKSHHAQSHGESIAEKSTFTCEVCGDSFEGYDYDTNRFCSAECKYEWDSKRISGDGSPSWKDAKVQLACDNCGDRFERFQSEVDRYQKNFCCQGCKAEYQQERYLGENNPAWSGGEIRNRYGKQWSSLACDIVSADGKCLSCGIKNEEHIDSTGRRLDVHHVVPRREFDDVEKANRPSNLVSLCRECHNAVESGKIDCPDVPDRNI